MYLSNSEKNSCDCQFTKQEFDPWINRLSFDDNNQLHSPISVNSKSSPTLSLTNCCDHNDIYFSQKSPKPNRIHRSFAYNCMCCKKNKILNRRDSNDTLDPHTTSKNSLNLPRRIFSCVVNPYCYMLHLWNGIVSFTVLYNIWIIGYRFPFNEITNDTRIYWFSLDYTADFIYIMDIFMGLHTSYLHEGVIQKSLNLIRKNYLNSSYFYLDMASIIPLDILYLSFGYYSILRIIRSMKLYKVIAFLNRVERHTKYPNIFRAVQLVHNLILFMHWNACLYFIVTQKMVIKGHELLNKLKHTDIHQIIAENSIIGCRDHISLKASVDSWGKVYSMSSGGFPVYLNTMYYSTLSLCLTGSGIPHPFTVESYIFVIFELVFGLFVFAFILSYVSNTMASIYREKKDFQNRVKYFMSAQSVPANLQKRVVRWYDHLQLDECRDDISILNDLPQRLRAEISIHIHLNTLKQVDIFQYATEGFLAELVLQLQPELFAPGDFVCKKGEVGREMYIVNKGLLEVLNGPTADGPYRVINILKAGSYFGEIAILNFKNKSARKYGKILKNGNDKLLLRSKSATDTKEIVSSSDDECDYKFNRRTASIRSIGYSNLFRLSKEDLWRVLNDFPKMRKRIERISAQRRKIFQEERFKFERS